MRFPRHRAILKPRREWLKGYALKHKRWPYIPMKERKLEAWGEADWNHCSTESGFLYRLLCHPIRYWDVIARNKR